MDWLPQTLHYSIIGKVFGAFVAMECTLVKCMANMAWGTACLEGGLELLSILRGFERKPEHHVLVQATFGRIIVVLFIFMPPICSFSSPVLYFLHFATLNSLFQEIEYVKVRPQV